MRIRAATLADVDALAQLGRVTFIEAFGHLYSPEDLAAFLEDSHSPAAYRRILEADIVLLAQDGEDLLGYCTGGRCKLPVPSLEPAAGEIKRVYVRVSAHGRKVGSQLMDRLIAELERREHDPLYVGVWSQNHGAQRLYMRYGFAKVGEYEFPVGKQLDREFILRRAPRSPVPGLR